MRQRIRDFVFGECVTAPLSQRQIRTEAEHLWRRPFDLVNVPGHHGPDSLLYRVLFLFGFPPGWKLAIYTHEDHDPMPPHTHAGRILSFVLKGGYVEERIDGEPDAAPRYVSRKPFHFNWLPTNTWHRVVHLPKGKAKTLVLTFPSVQEPQYAVNGKSVDMLSYWRGEVATS